MLPLSPGDKTGKTQTLKIKRVVDEEVVLPVIRIKANLGYSFRDESHLMGREIR